MGKIGFGSYRVSIKSNEHYNALLLALKSGVSLIDTSSNYTNGESEELIGKVLKDHPEFNPIIVTKAGYIQGKNLVSLATTEDLVEISDGLKHSIHPHFLCDQLNKSLLRLGRSSVDVFLLHNPEYYFKSENAHVDEFYKRIEKAFRYLEEEVSAGRIKSYGVSSNHFVLPHNDPEYVSAEKMLDIAISINKKHHFTHIQFPMNLIEIGALEKYGDYGNFSLIEFAQMNQLVTLVNRPLNAFTNNQLVRLATYEFLLSSFDEKKAEEKLEECLQLLNSKWIAEQKKDGEEVLEELRSTTLIKQFLEIWRNLPSPDAVDQVYHGHFFPFVAQVWGGNLTAAESKPFYDLYEFSRLFSYKMMDEKARKFRGQAVSVGLMADDDFKIFSKSVIETYLSYGIDYVLVGMRKVEYVDQLKELF